MNRHRIRPRTLVPAVAAASLLAVAGCASDEAGPGGDSGPVEIDFLVDNSADTVAAAEAMVEAFEAENSDISITLDTRPGGADGDNVVKTRLSTDEMADVFLYNTGSLFQALNPDKTLVDLHDQPWVSDLEEGFVTTVSTDDGVYGNAWGASFGGGILYNRVVYDDLGLEVPESWDDFMANNEVIADAGLDAIIQTYGSTWSSQLFVLADFANVLTADPDWADEYTANKRSYADEPALYAFQHQQEAYEAGYFNANFAAADTSDGARMLAEGTGVHYPILSNLIAQIDQVDPEAVDDIGYFPIPAEDAANTAATIWQPPALYIPQTTEGAQREAALKFLEFLTTEESCAIQTEHLAVAGPYPGTCPLPDDAAPILTDIASYIDDGRAAPALEFLSPIKGPNLEHIMVEVGSAITTAEQGAERYDEDVVNQARQLGLEGW